MNKRSSTLLCTSNSSASTVIFLAYDNDAEKQNLSFVAFEGFLHVRARAVKWLPRHRVVIVTQACLYFWCTALLFIF